MLAYLCVKIKKKCLLYNSTSYILNATIFIPINFIVPYKIYSYNTEV